MVFLTKISPRKLTCNGRFYVYKRAVTLFYLYHKIRNVFLLQSLYIMRITKASKKAVPACQKEEKWTIEE